jgi:RNA recognition motif-containing protein
MSTNATYTGGSTTTKTDTLTKITVAFVINICPNKQTSISSNLRSRGLDTKTTDKSLKERFSEYGTISEAVRLFPAYTRRRYLN